MVQINKLWFVKMSAKVFISASFNKVFTLTVMLLFKNLATKKATREMFLLMD